VKVGIHQPNFMPWAGYIRKICESDKFIILDDVKCSKNSFFNRNRFSSNKKFNSSFWLSCPLPKESYRKNLSDVEVNSAFIKKHIKYFKTRHGKSSESEFLEEIIQTYEKNESYDFINLSSLNCEFISLILKYLNIEVDILRSSCINLSDKFQKQDLLIKIIKEVNGDTYISGHGAKNYQSADLFQSSGISLKYISEDFKNIKMIENQHVSIVDLMLHEGIWKVKKMILH